MGIEPRASILVVDDTIENLRLLSGILGDRGYEPRPVTNGRDALGAAEQEPPDLILLDVTMPDMSGFDVCRALKAHPTLKHIPVIFLTALTDVQDKVAGFSLGGVDFITKPFHVDEVVARVASQVALKRARQELAESLEQLRGLERLRDDLVQMIVHDMRSPLMALKFNLEFLREGLGNGARSAQAAEDLGEALRACTTLKRMANDLLDVSRMEAGKLPLLRTTADLAAIATTVSEDFSGWERTRNISVKSDGTVPVSCDHDLIRRVIENLVSNAIKHTPGGGAIRIAVSMHQGNAHVAVHDEGPGVPVEAREQIFDKFGTVTTRQDKQYHSAGLGLAYCKLAVVAHGGRIGVDAGGAGGSIFWFELPAPPGLQHP